MKTIENDSIQLSRISQHEKPKIAIIDDEHKWLKLFKRIYRDSDYAVDTYSDPQEFLHTIIQYPKTYVGIICDIKMPFMDGHQVFEAIKQNKETQNIPFLIVSGVLTQDQHLSKVQGIPYVSKLDDNLRVKVFEELIEVIENWPKIRDYLCSQNVQEDKIDFFCQFFINYHRHFNEILKYVNKMEKAYVSSDDGAIMQISAQCNVYMNNLQTTCMELISLIQENPEVNNFIRKVCMRSRTSLSMIQNFQFLLSEGLSSDHGFMTFLKECKESLEKIIIGTEAGYNLRDTD